MIVLAVFASVGWAHKAVWQPMLKPLLARIFKHDPA